MAWPLFDLIFIRPDLYLTRPSSDLTIHLTLPSSDPTFIRPDLHLTRPTSDPTYIWPDFRWFFGNFVTNYGKYLGQVWADFGTILGTNLWVLFGEYWDQFWANFRAHSRPILGPILGLILGLISKPIFGLILSWFRGRFCLWSTFARGRLCP
jgi:hypothetical protein